MRVGLATACAMVVCACGSAGDGTAPAPSAASLRATPDHADEPIEVEPAALHPVTTVVITDDPVAVAAGSTSGQDWPSLLATILARAGTPLDLTPAAVEGAGFAGGGRHFTGLVQDLVTHPTQLVIFFDTEGAVDASAVQTGVAEALSAVERQAPDALAVVVAPLATGGELEAGMEVRAGMREAAHGSEVTVTYVDPNTEGWPIGASQQQVADLLYDHLAQLVELLAKSGAFE